MTKRAVFTLVFAAIAFGEEASALAARARAELYAARFGPAAALYQELIAAYPDARCHAKLTEALIGAHRAADAYRAADAALARATQDADTQTAGGLVAFRKGEIVQAERYFRMALRKDPSHAGALRGLAEVLSTVSLARTAGRLIEQAYAAEPLNPALVQLHANQLKGAAHIEMVAKALSLVDAESEVGKALRVHLAMDKALEGRQLRRLISAYEPAKVPMLSIRGGSSGMPRGFGLRVRFNGSHTFTLLLDTGASGLSISPKAAQKAGLELVTSETREVKGIGDAKPMESTSYLAAEVKIGNLVFADWPVSAFRSAKDSDIDGLMGADVFRRFLITLNFAGRQLELTPFASMPDNEPVDAGTPEPGWDRAFRLGNHLLVPTQINQTPSKLFLIDSGSSANLIDTEVARGVTRVHSSEQVVHGVQGQAKHVSSADRITLTFSGFRQENPDLTALNLDKMSDGMGSAVSGVLGIPVLGQLIISINYRDGTVRFTR